MQMPTLKCGAECWHRNETLGHPVCLNYMWRRINHCWGLHIDFRKIITFYILQTTSTEVQLTGYILKAADKKRWNMGWGRSMV